MANALKDKKQVMTLKYFSEMKKFSSTRTMLAWMAGKQDKVTKKTKNTDRSCTQHCVEEIKSIKKMGWSLCNARVSYEVIRTFLKISQ